VSFTADVGQPKAIFERCRGDRLTHGAENAYPSYTLRRLLGAYYINRNGDWSVACDALGRIIRYETEKLALSVARYRRRRLRQFCE
jgi:hypothetical protein